MDADRWERKRQRFERRMRRMEQHWERRHYRLRSPGRHLFSGLVFVVVGAIFLLGNMGIVEVDRILRFWPVLLIAAGMFKIIESGNDYGESSGIFWVVIGGLFLLGNLGILRVAFRDLWPVVLIGIGALMLWRSALARRPPRESSQGANASSFSENTGGSTTRSTYVYEGPAAPASSNSIISAMAILGSVERRNNSQDFRGGSATAVMGRCEIDLRTAAIAAPHEAVLDVFAMWGGIEVRVPPDWTVVSQVDPILGGYDDSTLPPKEESKRFIIRGSVIMGGIEVTN